MKYWLFDCVTHEPGGGIRDILHQPSCKYKIFIITILIYNKVILPSLYAVDKKNWRKHNFVFINKYTGNPLTSLYRIVTSTMLNYTGKMINPQLLR
jgi:hypothetical protein